MLLAIETTCDETAAAVIDRSRTVLSSVVASQDSLHARWRGVVPEVASRAHVERIVPVIDEAVSRAGVSRPDLEAVAVAVTPGLVGSLLVGLSAAKAVAMSLGIPIVGYDHVAAHLYACRLTHGDRLRYPCVGLVASGGHTSLFHVRSPLELVRLGGTIDDAAGEAFDKAASLLGLGYPGGPQIERAAVGGDPRAHRLPRPLAADRERLDLSFSGLKTALRYLVRPPGHDQTVDAPQGRRLADLAASFQQAAVDSILAKVELALRRTGCRCLAVGGGVTANAALRDALERLGDRIGVAVLIPPRSLCTDNAAMGAIAWERLERGEDDGLDLDVSPGTDRSQSRKPRA
ncbi:MAG: tRNA (adenosine(37)-N6)-threonylcarbamoyltransferase complex transferase subunit TsaD [Planctomycetia bacterium]|nr:tRNA (adenosine(37)-N6)-threonylcarbamoyltransferase complex transferase subunit TsaD [Planctomycetia bacterium]